MISNKMNLKEGEDRPVVNEKDLSIKKDALTLNVGSSSSQIMERISKKMKLKDGEERHVANEKDLSIEKAALDVGESSPQIMERQKCGDVDLLNEKDQDQDIRKNKILHIELFL